MRKKSGRIFNITRKIGHILRFKDLIFKNNSLTKIFPPYRGKEKSVGLFEFIQTEKQMLLKAIGLNASCNGTILYIWSYKK